MSVCTFFGHRDCSDKIETDLYECVEKLICEKNVDVFYVGNQGNFDAIVTRVLKKLQQKYPNINCMIVLAYIPVERVEFVFDTVYPEKAENVPLRFAVNFRNKWMINKADYVVGCVYHSFGGAYNFLELARKKNKNVINLAE